MANGFLLSRTTALACHPLTGRQSLGYSNGYIRLPSTPVPGWASPFANASSNAIEVQSGSNQNPDGDRDSLSAFPDENLSQQVYSILIIEDNPTDIFLIKEALRIHGIRAELQIIEDGEEAIRLFQRLDSPGGLSCPNLILLDINLPRTNGFEALGRLRESRKGGSIPVIVMSSSETDVDRLHAANLQAREYFQKPPDYEGFLQIGLVIERILRG